MCFLLIDETQQQEVTPLKRPFASCPIGCGGGISAVLVGGDKSAPPPEIGETDHPAREGQITRRRGWR